MAHESISSIVIKAFTCEVSRCVGTYSSDMTWVHLTLIHICIEKCYVLDLSTFTFDYDTE